MHRTIRDDNGYMMTVGEAELGYRAESAIMSESVSQYRDRSVYGIYWFTNLLRDRRRGWRT